LTRTPNQRLQRTHVPRRRLTEPSSPTTSKQAAKRPFFSNDTIAKRLLALIDACTRIDSQGKVSFVGDFRFDDWQILLGEVLKLSEEIPALERKRIVWQSLHSAAQIGRITGKSFLKEVQGLERSYLHRRPKRYVLITSISVATHNDLPAARIGDSTVSFPRTIPAAFRRHRAGVIEMASPSLFAELPSGYRPVRVAARSRSDDAASSKCLDALNLLRGLWNLYLNAKKGPRKTFGGQREPVNTIVLGPVHSIHLASGRVERDIWSYEPNYCGATQVADLGHDVAPMHQFVLAMRRKLRKIPYRRCLEEAIRRYCEALDDRDWSASFLRMWQVLESATYTTKGQPHTVTVRRAAFLWDDHELHAALLDHLRELRNRLVHRGAEAQEIEYFLFRLKKYVEVVLLFHLNRAGEFPSLERAAEFLDLPNERHEMLRLATLYKKALPFCS
jgi:hypothetical protein